MTPPPAVDPVFNVPFLMASNVDLYFAVCDAGMTYSCPWTKPANEFVDTPPVYPPEAKPEPQPPAPHKPPAPKPPPPPPIEGTEPPPAKPIIPPRKPPPPPIKPLNNC